ncbi:MAG: polyisoprenoid-binding protein YceI [Saprospiraceae bacterium]|jgi:polyisoprenoid-binding protein YceI
MKYLIAFIAIPLFLLSFTIINEYILDYKVSDDFTMVIKGTSNVHDWESEIEKVSGNFSISYGEDGTLQIRECEVTIPVKSIKSGRGIMDKKTWAALEADRNPNIKYRLSSCTNMIKTGSNFTANTTGKLTIAGTTKLVGIKIIGKELANGSMEITGSKALKMTDFNIDPPTALMGTMTTGDDITIEFRIVLNEN